MPTRFRRSQKAGHEMAAGQDDRAMPQAFFRTDFIERQETQLRKPRAKDDAEKGDGREPVDHGQQKLSRKSFAERVRAEKADGDGASDRDGGEQRHQAPACQLQHRKKRNGVAGGGFALVPQPVAQEQEDQDDQPTQTQAQRENLRRRCHRNRARPQQLLIKLRQGRHRIHELGLETIDDLFCADDPVTDIDHGFRGAR